MVQRRCAYLEYKDQRNQSLSSLIWVWPFDQFLVNVNRLVAIKRDLCDCVEQIGNPTSPVWKNLSQVWKIRIQDWSNYKMQEIDYVDETNQLTFSSLSFL